MKVIAKGPGYHALIRRRKGEVFEMSTASMKQAKDGAPILPSWVEKFDGRRPAAAPEPAKSAPPEEGGKAVL